MNKVVVYQISNKVNAAQDHKSIGKKRSCSRLMTQKNGKNKGGVTDQEVCGGSRLY